MKATERPKWRKKEIGKKVHNASGTARVKADIRRNVLEHVRPARVLDAYCGPDGMMFQDVWHAADAYIGIDEEWKPTDTRRRHAATTRALSGRSTCRRSTCLTSTRSARRGS